MEYIIDYFRALLDYEETPLAEDEPNELDDEKARAYRGLSEFFATPAEVRFEGNPADCAFPKSPDFRIERWGFKSTPTAKDEANGAADEPDAAEDADGEDDNQTTESDETAGEDTPPAELDNENDTQAAESDEAADEPAAGAPISEADILLPPGVVPITENVTRCWEELTSKERAAVRETFAMWGEMNDITGRNSGGGDYAEAVKELDGAEWWFFHAKSLLIDGFPKSLVRNESNLRKRINRVIDAIPGFRESEKFKKLIELYPTYKE